MKTEITVEQAKEVLKSKGYYVENLWHVNDVLSKMVTPNLSNEDCLDILDCALCNDSVMENINDKIIDVLEEDGYQLTED